MDAGRVQVRVFCVVCARSSFVGAMGERGASSRTEKRACLSTAAALQPQPNCWRGHSGVELLCRASE
jgi:hypothetical protein